MLTHFEHDPEDSDVDKLLCGEIGAILRQHYGGWTWRIEVPPKQDIVIIRNQDLLSASGNKPWCMSIHKSKLTGGNVRISVLRAAGEMLERYESMRGHCGRFRPEDVAERRQLIARPEV